MPRDFGAYFGAPWPSGICQAEDSHRVATPVGEKCLLCNEEIEADHQGSFMGSFEHTFLQPVHRECSLREVLGGIGHLTNCVFWCKEEHDPDASFSRRQSSLRVWDWVQAHGMP